MTKWKLILNIVGYVITFVLLQMMFSDIIPKMVVSPQDYLYNINSALFMFGFGCVIIGIEIKSCISDYLWWKYYGDNK